MSVDYVELTEVRNLTKLNHSTCLTGLNVLATDFFGHDVKCGFEMRDCNLAFIKCHFVVTQRVRVRTSFSETVTCRDLERVLHSLFSTID